MIRRFIRPIDEPLLTSGLYLKDDNVILTCHWPHGSTAVLGCPVPRTHGLYLKATGSLARQHGCIGLPCSHGHIRHPD